MTASTSAYKSVGGGAPARRKRANLPFSRLGISRAGLQALGHGVALPGGPARSCPALTMLFSGLDCRRHLARAARLITERRACIPGRRVPSVQRGNAAMPKPINDIALAFLRSLPEALPGRALSG
jgi:hypothetical protein